MNVEHYASRGSKQESHRLLTPTQPNKIGSSEMESSANVSSLPRHLAQIVAGNIDGRAANIRYRQNQFHRLQNSILKNLNELKQAIADDSGHTQQEVQAEVALAVNEIHTHYASLDVARSVEVEYRISNGKDNRDNRRGAGIIYIIPSQHTLFYSVIAALSAALAAGNSTIIEVHDSHPVSRPEQF
jgi:acyl-CoA reductase-like NAD-dependent aldehyde dehydrogenase